MTSDQSSWLNRLLSIPGRGEFTNEELDELFHRQSGANTTLERTWQLRDARNQLSELVRRVRHGEAQLITVRGKPAAMLVPVEGDRTRLHSPDKSLGAVLLSAPHVLTDDEADRLFDRHEETPRRATDDA